MPHKIWAVGEEVQAADFNTYLQNQTVPQFPNVAARDTWAAPPKGAVCVTTDTNAVWLYTGATWGVFSPNMPRARVYRTTSQGFSSGTFTIQLFNTARWNVGVMWSAANNSRLTIPPGGSGLYALQAGVRFATNSQGMRQVAIRRNGSQALVYQNTPATETIGAATDLSCSTMYELNVGDYVEVQIYQSSGNNLNSDPALNAAPEFSAAWVAPLA